MTPDEHAHLQELEGLVKRYRSRIVTLKQALVEREAHAYLSRLLTHYAPQCEPLPDLLGLCSQIDNLLVGLGKKTGPEGSFGYCAVCYHPLDTCSHCDLTEKYATQLHLKD